MHPVSRDIRAIWNQSKIPVVLRRGGKGQRPRARLPRGRARLPEDKVWLRHTHRHYPEWNILESYWEFPASWFNDFVNRALKKYGQLYVIQPYREQEVCARACMEALGHECQCSCMGANHGAGVDDSWFEVSDSFATRWGDVQLACRLMKLRR